MAQQVQQQPAGHALPPTGLLLRVTGLSKSFGGVAALDRVSLDLAPGTVHGLVGANGAGKSTLIRCLAGLVRPDSGEVLLDGAPVTIPDPQRATELGLSFIHQELNLVPRFSVAQNLLLGLPTRGRWGIGGTGGTRRQAEQVATRMRFPFGLDRPVEELSTADQWMVSIGRALVRQARVIAMDEPTASLSEAEVERLFGIVEDLAADGIGILYVSHRLDEILRVCDEVTVFRNGRSIDHLDRGRLSRERLIVGITGVPSQAAPADVQAASDEPAGEKRPALLELERVTTKSVHDVTFTVHRGEVVGLVGLVGSGRTEVARAVFGIDRVLAGRLRVGGEDVHFRSPRDAVAAGVGLVPEERRSQALLLKSPVFVNINLANLRAFRLVRALPLLSRRREMRVAAETATALQVKTRRMSDPVGSLSGGNQQKVVIGRWVSRDAKVLVLDELSRGVDIGARAEIHRLLHEYAAQGRAVLAISSETEELVDLCDRVVVMREGTTTGVVPRREATEQRLIAMSYGHNESGDERGDA
jgi:ribose transport system ATP-binding protein